MKKLGFIVSSLMLVAILSAVAQISVSTLFATNGITYSNLALQAESLEKENIILRQHVYMTASLTNIASVAATLGYVEPKKTAQLSIVHTVPQVAYKQ